MRKKLFFFISPLISLFFTALPVSAASNYVTISCPATAPIGSPTTCSISGHSSSLISGVAISLSTNNLQIIDFTADSSWYGDANNGQIVIATDTNKTGDFNIGTVSVQPSSVGIKGSIDLTNIIFSNDSFFEFSVSDSSTTITSVTAPSAPAKPPEETTESTSSSLKNLEISGYDIDFASDRYTYTVHIPDNVSSLDITATPEVETAIVTISGNENLANDSTIKITVENGEEKSIYRIKIASDIIISGKVEDDSTGKIFIISIILAIALASTVICAFFIFRKKKPKTPSSTKPPVYKTSPKPSTNPFLNRKPELDLVQNLPIENDENATKKQTTVPKTQKTPIPSEKSTEFSNFGKVFQSHPTPKSSPIQSEAQPKQQSKTQPAPQKSNQSISLDQIPFDQPSNSPQIKRPTTPIIFES